MSHRLHRSNTKGAAMVVAMIFIVICVIATGAYLFVITKDSNLAKKMNDSIKALYVAEAGIERAVSDLGGLGVWSLGVLYSNTPHGEGTFTAEIIELINNNRVRLKSTGVVREEDRIITAYVSRPSVFDWGVFGDDGVFLDSNAYIDSYNSTLGPYGGTNINQNGDVGTNAGDGEGGVIAVSLGSNARIYGDVTIGPNGDVGADITMGSGALITGTQSAAQTETPLPTVTPPDGLQYRGQIALGGDDSITISESGWYDLITLNSNSSIVIDADVTLYVAGGFSLNSNSHIDIINNADVTIYMGSTFVMDSNTVINNVSQDPLLLTLYGTSSMTSATLNSNSAFYGAIYTPTVFELDSNAIIYGSLVANSVSMNSNAIVHYDEALAGSGPPLGGPLNVDFWQEKY